MNIPQYMNTMPFGLFVGSGAETGGYEPSGGYRGSYADFVGETLAALLQRVATHPAHAVKVLFLVNAWAHRREALERDKKIYLLLNGFCSVLRHGQQPTSIDELLILVTDRVTECLNKEPQQCSILNEGML